MVVVNFLYGLEVDDSLQLPLVTVCSREEKRLGMHRDQSDKREKLLVQQHKKKQNKKVIAHSHTVMPKKHSSSRLTSIVGQPPVVHVKQEPSLLPRLDSPPSLGQEAGAASGRQPQVGAGGHAVTQGLQVGAEVKVGGEEERHLLGTQAEFRWGEEDSESWQRKAC